MDLKNTQLQKQVLFSAFLGPALMAAAFVIAAAQAQFIWQPFLWLATLGLWACWHWRLHGWYATVVALGAAIGWQPDLSAFQVTLIVALALSGWITAMGYAEIESGGLKELMLEGGKQYRAAVAKLETEVAAWQQLDRQKDLQLHQLQQKLHDSQAQAMLGEHELRVHRLKVEELLTACDIKEKALQHKLDELQAAHDRVLSTSLDWQLKASHCVQLEDKLASTLHLLEQCQQKGRYCDELEIRYARALSDIEQWQLRVQQLMESSADVSTATPSEVAELPALEGSLVLAEGVDAAPPLAELKAPLAKGSAKSKGKSKGSKDKKTNHWANAILSRWSEPHSPSQ